MKKTILLSSILAAGAVLAEANVDSSVIGALPTNVSADQQLLIPAPFVGNAENGTIAVNDMVKTSDLDDGALLYVANEAGGYDMWKLQGGEWTAAKKVSVVNGELSESETPSATVATVKRGDAFWLVPKNSGSVILLGNRDEAASRTIPAKAGLNLIGNPTIAEYDVLKALRNSSNGDQVIVNNNGSQLTYTKQADVWKFRDPSTHKVATVTSIQLQPGEACWFKAGAAQNIVW